MIGEPSVNGVVLPRRFMTLLASLDTQGFSIIQQAASEASFGDIQVILGDGILDVELLRDRGQPFVSIGLAGERRLPVGVWRALIAQSPTADLGTTFDEEVVFVEQALSAVRELAAGTDVHAALSSLLESATSSSDELRSTLYD